MVDAYSYYNQQLAIPYDNLNVQRNFDIMIMKKSMPREIVGWHCQSRHMQWRGRASDGVTVWANKKKYYLIISSTNHCMLLLL